MSCFSFTRLAALILIPFFTSAAPAPGALPGVFPLATWEKYHCLTFETYETLIPPCASYCETKTLTTGADGCAPDDFVCHCAHYQRIADIIEPCIFPSINASSACTFAELEPLQALVTDSCTFFNATGYADYAGCAPNVLLEVLEDELHGGH